MLKTLFKNRVVLWELAKNDRKARFSSALLGGIWSFLQPLINMLVIWLVFQVGFKSSNLADDTPFIIWYMPAFLIWTYFQDALSQSSSSLLEYAYLVRKVNFNVEIIPPIKIISNAIIHCFFLVFIVIVNLCYGKMPSVYNLQAFYYFFCAAALALAIGWFCAGLAPFATDITNIVAILIQLGFWITPIFWDPSSLKDSVKLLLKLNPMYYVCMGYRDSFVYEKLFTEHMHQTLYFWTLTLILWAIGVRTYKKSMPHFADVL